MSAAAMQALERKRQVAHWYEHPDSRRFARTWGEFLLEHYQERITTNEQRRQLAERELAELQDLEHRLAAQHAQHGTGDADDDEDLPAELAAELARWGQWNEDRAAELLVERGDPFTSELTPDLEGWCAARAGWARRAAAFWIAEPMVQLVDAAYRSMPEQPLRDTDLPTPDGFALLDNRAWFRDARDSGRALDLPAAVSWETLSAPATTGGPPVPGVRLCWWFERANLAERRRWVAGDIGAGPLVPYAMFWPFGQVNVGGSIEVNDAHNNRWFAAMCSLMERPMVQAERTPADRASRKRAQRAGLDPDVTVVTLRTPRGPAGAPTGKVDWKARWVVRGFWRKQWYASVQEHRAIWIDEHIKGPADRPLRIREHVYAWRR